MSTDKNEKCMFRKENKESKETSESHWTGLSKFTQVMVWIQMRMKKKVMEALECSLVFD